MQDENAACFPASFCQQIGETVNSSLSQMTRVSQAALAAAVWPVPAPTIKFADVHFPHDDAIMGRHAEMSPSGQSNPSVPPSRNTTPRLSLRSSTCGDGSEVRVRVVARVRPLLPWEACATSAGVGSCVEVSDTTLHVGKTSFAFDRAFGPETDQHSVYQECVAPLVDATFQGIHGTLLAYGQTGSGKTHTMGTSCLPNVPEGAVQRALSEIFQRVEAKTAEGFAVRCCVSYVEIFTDLRPNPSGRGTSASEEIRDLLTRRSQHLASLKVDVSGEVKLDGVSEHEVWSAREAFDLLRVGSLSRVTAATRMNDQSSRSHALFMIEVCQHKEGTEPSDSAASTLTARFQFVDLAGSEKVKASGAQGDQLSQAININHGLFVLGKVITALTDCNLHVPFRESKLTRILQNSLGGNSKTCMIACASPSETNMAETLSTLKYAARAQEIRNRPVINATSVCSKCAVLRAKVKEMEERLRQGDGTEPVQSATSKSFLQVCRDDLEREVSSLRCERDQLQQDLYAARREVKRGRSHSHHDPGRVIISGDQEELQPEVTGTGDELSELRRYKALYLRCSDKLSALQDSVRKAELNVEPHLLKEMEGPIVHFGDETEDFDEENITPEESDSDDEYRWLDQEANRKNRLILQVEDNHQSLMVMEQIQQERVRQHEAARDIAERELARLQSELDAARSQNQHLANLQEQYDNRLQNLRSRNVSLEKEQKDVQRLRSLQKQQEIRLRVLRDSVQSVTAQRDDLKEKLKNEGRKRKELDAQAKVDKRAAQQKIKSLSRRVAALERSGGGNINANDSDVGSACSFPLRGPRSRQSLPADYGRQRSFNDRSSIIGDRAAGEAINSPCPAIVLSARHVIDGDLAAGAITSCTPGDALRSVISHSSGDQAAGVGSQRIPEDDTAVQSNFSQPAFVGFSVDHRGLIWEELFKLLSDQSELEERLFQASERLADAEGKSRDATAARDRLSLEAEFDNEEAAGGKTREALRRAQAEADSTAAAMEYQQEQVWVVQQEIKTCPRLSVESAVSSLAASMQPQELEYSVHWLANQVYREHQALRASRRECKAVQAEMAVSQLEIVNCQHHAAEQERAFDVSRSDYESRVAYLIKRLSDDGTVVEMTDLKDAIGEDTVTFLTRRVEDLEEALQREKQQAKNSSHKKFETDLELITACQNHNIEAKSLRQQVAEAEAQANRAKTRGAQKEAQLRQDVSRLQEVVKRFESADTPGPERCFARGISQGSSESSPAVPLGVAWGLSYLEGFWKATGLVQDRDSILLSLKTDVEALCEQKLEVHLEWKRELEDRVKRLEGQVAVMTEALQEPVDLPDPTENLLQRAMAFENAVRYLGDLATKRQLQAESLATRAENVYRRLYESPCSSPWLPTGAATIEVDVPDEVGASSSNHGGGRLLTLFSPEAVAELLAQIERLEEIETARQAEVLLALDRLRELWIAIGLQIPEELALEEAVILSMVTSGNAPPVSNSTLAFTETRIADLRQQRCQLLAQEGASRERWEVWARRLSPFGILPDRPSTAGHPLVQRSRTMQTAATLIEETALNFLKDEVTSFRQLASNSNLANVDEVLGEISGCSNLESQLQALANHWARMSQQRADHRRAEELVESRECLEEEMRAFDIEASDPNRFKRRGYSGVQESRRRTENQRKLKSIDASLTELLAEWHRREGAAFCIDGKEYRGATILPHEHTHMYAWTGRQVAEKQREAARGSTAFVPPLRVPPGQVATSVPTSSASGNNVGSARATSGYGRRSASTSATASAPSPLSLTSAMRHGGGSPRVSRRVDRR